MTLRDLAGLRDQILLERLDLIVPRVMHRTGIDCWIVAAREYNEDPVLTTMLPSDWFNARRRTVLVFTDYGRERAAIARYDVGDAFRGVWDGTGDQWLAVAHHVAAAGPDRIAVNESSTFPLADGLSSSEAAALRAALGAESGQRIVSANDLAVGWLETRSPTEMAHYPALCRQAHELLARALSPAVVIPGITSTEDVAWWLREESTNQGFRCWFHPTVSVQRPEGRERRSFTAAPPDVIIERGDLLHIDFGIEHLGLHTDQQQHAYVLRPGESAPPSGLRTGLAAANRAQDHLLAQFATGRTGNQILGAALAAARTDGIDAMVYSHPIGLHGHAAGPTIGLWDAQVDVPGAGDHAVWPDTAYSIELSATVPIPEWDGRHVRIMLEEDAYFDGDRIEYLDGRQTEFWTI